MRADIMVDIGGVRMALQDGGPPTTLAAGSAPGESGVSVVSVRFDGSRHLLTTPRCHCICFQMPPGRVERRMAGRVVRLERLVGSLTIYPAGFDCAADPDEDIDILVVAEPMRDGADPVTASRSCCLTTTTSDARHEPQLRLRCSRSSPRSAATLDAVAHPRRGPANARPHWG